MATVTYFDHSKRKNVSYEVPDIQIDEMQKMAVQYIMGPVNDGVAAGNVNRDQYVEYLDEALDFSHWCVNRYLDEETNLCHGAVDLRASWHAYLQHKIEQAKV